jgi:hypothetical protein
MEFTGERRKRFEEDNRKERERKMIRGRRLKL